MEKAAGDSISQDRVEMLSTHRDKTTEYKRGEERERKAAVKMEQREKESDRAVDTPIWWCM